MVLRYYWKTVVFVNHKWCLNLNILKNTIAKESDKFQGWMDEYQFAHSTTIVTNNALGHYVADNALVSKLLINTNVLIY